MYSYLADELLIYLSPPDPEKCVIKEGHRRPHNKSYLPDGCLLIDRCTMGAHIEHRRLGRALGRVLELGDGGVVG